VTATPLTQQQASCVSSLVGKARLPWHHYCESCASVCHWRCVFALLCRTPWQQQQQQVQPLGLSSSSQLMFTGWHCWVTCSTATYHTPCNDACMVASQGRVRKTSPPGTHCVVLQKCPTIKRLQRRQGAVQASMSSMTSSPQELAQQTVESRRTVYGRPSCLLD